MKTRSTFDKKPVLNKKAATYAVLASLFKSEEEITWGLSKNDIVNACIDDHKNSKQKFTKADLDDVSPILYELICDEVESNKKYVRSTWNYWHSSVPQFKIGDAVAWCITNLVNVKDINLVDSKRTSTLMANIIGYRLDNSESIANYQPFNYTRAEVRLSWLPLPLAFVKEHYPDLLPMLKVGMAIGQNEKEILLQWKHKMQQKSCGGEIMLPTLDT